MIGQGSLIKYFFLVTCLILVVYSVAAGKANSQSCTESIQCCSRYCRNGRCINFGDADDDKGFRNPCQPSPCEENQICVLQQVQCFTFPCPPIASCKSK